MADGPNWENAQPPQWGSNPDSNDGGGANWGNDTGALKQETDWNDAPK